MLKRKIGIITGTENGFSYLGLCKEEVASII